MSIKHPIVAITGSSGAGTTSVTMKVGLSYTGEDGARANLSKETGDGFDFDAVRAALTQRWETQLGHAHITGGSDKRRTAYHAALAHGANHLVTLVSQAMGLLRESGATDPAATLTDGDRISVGTSELVFRTGR